MALCREVETIELLMTDSELPHGAVDFEQHFVVHYLNDGDHYTCITSEFVAENGNMMRCLADLVTDSLID